MNLVNYYKGRFNVPPSSSVCPQGDPIRSFDVKSDNAQLLDYIYSIHPKSGHPTGDLAIYLGDKANPEIRQFIEMNLFNPMSVGKDGIFNLPTEVTNRFKEMSDDDYAFFSRNHDESREEYADRLKLFFLKEKEARLAKKRADELERVLKGESK